MRKTDRNDLEYETQIKIKKSSSFRIDTNYDYLYVFGLFKEQ